MDLFDYMREQNMQNESPLANRMRPKTLEEVVGQQHIIGKDKLLYRAIRADKLSSVIFYGPPGTGKPHLQRSLREQRKQNLCRSMQLPPEKRIWRLWSNRRRTVLACMEDGRSFL